MRFSLTVLTLLATLVYGDIYCAKWDVSGSTGVFVVETKAGSSSKMSLTGSFDTTSNLINTTACAAGLNWHYHAGWDATLGESSRTCGNATSLTFNHYDPTYSCNANSQWIKTPYCNQSLITPNRAAYACSPTIFNAQPYKCEVGDLSGKFGRISFSDGTLRTQNKYMEDVLPPMDADFQENAGNADKWSSFIIHCDAPRVVCAKFTKVNSWDECKIKEFSIAAPPSSNLTVVPPPSSAAPTTAAAENDNKLSLGIGLTFLVTTVFWVALALIWFKKQKKSTGNTGNFIEAQPRK